MITVIETIEEMQAYSARARRDGKRIALVPTMGALHEGHLTLMREAKQRADLVVASIFVNPTQFGPHEDFSNYPREKESDCQKAKNAGVDAIFYPAPTEMYPDGYATYIHVEGITAKLCGLTRPGHFKGVATVVAKLLNIVKPDIAVFGQKDAQQVLVLKRMVQDLNMDVKIAVLPIQRHDDGLALSSRNQYLSADERKAALVLSRSLNLAKQAVENGMRDIAQLQDKVRAEIVSEPLANIDYIEIYSYPALQEIKVLNGSALLALAVKIGQTRLIDNLILEA
jgi:pantoate--beta-alanine ligase